MLQPRPLNGPTHNKWRSKQNLLSDEGTRDYFLANQPLPSVFRHCWLGGKKGIRPVKKLSDGVLEWLFCLQRGAYLHMAKLMPLPLTDSCFSKIQISFTFLVPAHPGSTGQRAVKRVCVSMISRSQADARH